MPSPPRLGFEIALPSAGEFVDRTWRRTAKLGAGLAGGHMGFKAVRAVGQTGFYVNVVQPRLPYYLWPRASQAAIAVWGYSALYPALGPDHKIGLRFGATGDTVPMSKHWFLRHYTHGYGVSMKGLPVPQFGLGITSVPNDETRWGFATPGGKSRTPPVSVRYGRFSSRSRKGISPNNRRFLDDRRRSMSLKSAKITKRRGKRCPNGYRFNRKLNACVRSR